MGRLRIMQLPRSTTQQAYIDQVKIIEADLKAAASSGNDKALLSQVQEQLDILANKHQYSKELGTAIYKLYELQALVHYFSGNDDDALDFIHQAIKTRGDNYARAEKLKKQLLEKDNAKDSHRKSDTPPLELQALIKGQRASAGIMALLSILSIYFIPWAIFYIILARKLNPKRVPSRGLIKAAAIVTLPLCIGIIPIIIDIDFWRMNKQLKEYERQGAKVFASDKKWLAAEPKRKRGRKIAWSILLSILTILIVLVIVAVLNSNSTSQGSSSASLANNAVKQFKSSNTLPQDVDDVTTLTNVTASGSAIQYHYQIKDVDISSLSDEALYKNVQPGVCSNADTRNIIDSGVAMHYIYTVNGTDRQYTIEIQKTDCN